MIELGIIGKGPEVRKKPVVKEIHRLRDVLSEMDRGPLIELAFVIPGRLGQPDFDGFELSRRRGPNALDIVFVAVPPELANAQSPMAGLVQLGLQAIDYARSRSLLDPSDFDELENELKRAAARFDFGVEHQPRQHAQRPHRTRRLEVSADPEIGVEVTLAIRDRATLDDAYRVETALEEHLRQAALGYVDGNEIGEGLFIVYVYGPPSAALPRAVEDVVKAHWVHGNSRIETDTNESGSSAGRA